MTQKRMSLKCRMVGNSKAERGDLAMYEKIQISQEQAEEMIRLSTESFGFRSIQDEILSRWRERGFIKKSALDEAEARYRSFSTDDLPEIMTPSFVLRLIRAFRDDYMRVITEQQEKIKELEGNK